MVIWLCEQVFLMRIYYCPTIPMPQFFKKQSKVLWRWPLILSITDPSNHSLFFFGRFLWQLLMQIRGRRQGMGKLSCKFFQFTKLSETSEQHPANSSCKSCLFPYAFRLTNEDFFREMKNICIKKL